VLFPPPPHRLQSRQAGLCLLLFTLPLREPFPITFSLQGFSPPLLCGPMFLLVTLAPTPPFWSSFSDLFVPANPQPVSLVFFSARSRLSFHCLFPRGPSSITLPTAFCPCFLTPFERPMAPSYFLFFASFPSFPPSLL